MRKRRVAEAGTSNMERGTGNLEPGTGNMWNAELGTWNPEPATADSQALRLQIRSRACPGSVGGAQRLKRFFR